MHTVIASSDMNPLVPVIGDVLMIVLLWTMPAIVLYVWVALALSQLYPKLGVEGWKAWVPVYNAVLFLRFGGFSPWLLLLLLIPMFGQVFVYVAAVTSAHRINVAFGYGAWMTVLAAVLFPVWASILGFGAAEPDTDAQLYRYGLLDDSLGSTDGTQGLGALGLDSQEFLAKREELPPSAWIPAVAPVAEDATGDDEAGLRAADAASDPWTSILEPDTASGAGTRVIKAPEPPLIDQPGPELISEPEPEPAAVPDPVVVSTPEPVTSWWMPALEPDEPPVSEFAVGPFDEPEPVHEPVLRRRPVPEPEAFPEDSGAVSAVVDAPAAGAPLPATASVSAFRRPIDDDDFDERTVIAARRRAVWTLHLPDGTSIDLTADAAVLGRRPAPVHSAPGEQLVEIVEQTRTVSKTHALLRRQGENWVISDLGSTNGIVVDDVEIESGQVVPIGAEFLLGDAALRLERQER